MLLTSAAPRHVTLAASQRGLLTEEILQVFMLSTMEQVALLNPVP